MLCSPICIHRSTSHHPIIEGLFPLVTRSYYGILKTQGNDVDHSYVTASLSRLCSRFIQMPPAQAWVLFSPKVAVRLPSSAGSYPHV